MLNENIASRIVDIALDVVIVVKIAPGISKLFVKVPIHIGSTNPVVFLAFVPPYIARISIVG